MYLWGLTLTGILIIIILVTTKQNTIDIKMELKEIRKQLNDLNEKSNE